MIRSGLPFYSPQKEDYTGDYYLYSPKYYNEDISSSTAFIRKTAQVRSMGWEPKSEAEIRQGWSMEENTLLLDIKLL